MKKSITVTLAVLATVGAMAIPPLAMAEVQSLRGGVDVATPDAPPEDTAPLGAKPGLQKPIARSFQQQPPLIPHATAYFDDINLEENQCLSCHDVTTYKEKKAPRIGKSHFLDRDGKVQKTVSRTRYVCVQCHVPQTDAPPLVDNTFQPVPAKAAKGK